MYADDRIDRGTKKTESDGLNLYGFQKCEYNRIGVASTVAVGADLLDEIGVE